MLTIIIKSMFSQSDQSGMRCRQRFNEVQLLLITFLSKYSSVCLHTSSNIIGRFSQLTNKNSCLKPGINITEEETCRRHKREHHQVSLKYEATAATGSERGLYGPACKMCLLCQTHYSTLCADFVYRLINKCYTKAK